MYTMYKNWENVRFIQVFRVSQGNNHNSSKRGERIDAEGIEGGGKMKRQASHTCLEGIVNIGVCPYFSSFCWLVVCAE